MKPLNLFYEEPNPDRWIKFDRYLRNLIRRIIRGKRRPGGVMMVAINLMAGLDKLGIPYRFNDYRHINKHPDEIACIIGKPHLLFEKKWVNPVIFGAGVFSHPSEYPNLLKTHQNIKRILVPGQWMAEMFEPSYGNKVQAWPTGLDTDKWRPIPNAKTFDFLIYNKILWDQETNEKELLAPIIAILAKQKLTHQTIQYGRYTHPDLQEKLSQSKAVIFLCEHETQGLAYQQILATDTPVLAWEKGGYWQDPYYYPHKVKYQPVSSVPYWDQRCGLKFTSAADFEKQLMQFILLRQQFEPRKYIMENLTLELCAQKYLDIYQQVQAEING